MGESQQTFDFREINELYQLFAAPVLATIDADFYAARKFIEYIKEYGFDAPTTNPEAPKSDWGKLKTIKFRYFTQGQGGVLIEHRIELPLISLIPLPILQIDRATFDMNVRILGGVDQKSKTPDPPRLKNDKTVQEPAETTPQFLAILSPVNENKNDRLSPYLSANLKTHLSLVVSDLPVGIMKLLNVVQDANGGQMIPHYNRIVIKPEKIEAAVIGKQYTIELGFQTFDKTPLARQELFWKIENDDDAIELRPSTIVTDKDGMATVQLTIRKYSKLPITLNFWGDCSLKTSCTVTITQSTRSKGDDQ